MQIRYLDTPARIGPLTLRNRVIMAPLGTNFGTTDGFSTERDRSYYTERAVGGVAMIMTEAMIVSPGARNHHNSLCIFHDRFVPGLATLAESIKTAGALVVGQLSHRGGLLRRDVLNMAPVGPSAWRNPNTGDEVRPLDVADIVQIQKDYVNAARRLAEAGYDGIELHAANGYLFHQFFSRRVNKRTDAYGGSLEGRMRFLLETIARVRDELPDLPLFVRFSASEFIEGGYTQEEAVALARSLEQAGVDALDMSGGTNESPELSRFCIQPPSFPRRCLEPAVRPIKEAVSIPVILAGRIIEPADAEAVLEAGSADFVSLGRALVSDPHWVLKAFGKMEGPIRHCISCNVCFERLTRERDISCVQNPMVGTEFERLEHVTATPLPSHRRKRVLVIGAGVTGIEAANTAAARGHAVEVWEAGAAPGGQIEQAIAAPDKSEVRYVWEDRWKRFTALAIPLRLGKQVSIAEIMAFLPDHVILATGAMPRRPRMTWPEGTKVLQAWDVLKRPGLVAEGGEALVVGGGMVGIETADLLVALGCRVTIIEMQPSLAPEMARNNRTDILLRLKRAGTAIHVDTVIEGTKGRRIRLNRNGEASEITCPPHVVLATGSAPRADLASALEKAGVSFVVAGDAQVPGDFQSAIRDGQMAGLAVERRLDKAEAPKRPAHRTEAALG